MKEGERIKIKIGGLAGLQTKAGGLSPGTGAGFLLPPPPAGGAISTSKPLSNTLCSKDNNITTMTTVEDDLFGDFESFS